MYRYLAFVSNTKEFLCPNLFTVLRDIGWSDQDIYEATVHGANMVLSSALFKALKMGE